MSVFIKDNKIIIGEITYPIPNGISEIISIKTLPFFDGLILINGMMFEDPFYTQMGYASEHKLIRCNMMV
jgi:hypothetical protein